MQEMMALMQRYQSVMDRQVFDPEALDYRRLEALRPMLDGLARIKNSGVSVFDMHRREHVFASYNFGELFGYDQDRIANEGTSYFDSRIHPEDHLKLMALGIDLMELILATEPDRRMEYKIVNEYRIQSHDRGYVRVIEQHQGLELDRDGNIWLALSVLDLSPRQSTEGGIQSTLLNARTGEVVNLLQDSGPAATQVRLTTREREILSLIQQGHLSKEISEMLCISVHTVNTHRQRILEKLDAGNSIEAIQMAARYGLIN
ncbi:MAG: LuxR C-terminal-related transcriptional regulator [Bacteroidia bacterium]